MAIDTNNFYVYRHIRLDTNKPFYVGKGSGYRINSKQRNRLWKFIVAKTDYRSEIILDNLSEDEANLKEIEFIGIYGRIINKTGSLANFTNGGDGSSHVSYSEEDLAKKREIIIKLNKSRTGPKNNAYGKPSYWRGKKMYPEAVEKMRIAKIGQAVGEKNPSYGIARTNRPFTCFSLNGEEMKAFPSAEKMHKIYPHIDPSSVSKALKGKLITTGGFTNFRYIYG